MTTGIPPISTKGPAMPILALLVLGLALAAWFAPIPMLRPPAGPAPRAIEPPPLSDTIPAPDDSPKEPPAPWLSLASALDALTDKTPTSALVESDSKPAEESPPPQVVKPVVQPLGWRYRGTIDGPGSRAALIQFPDHRSRFVFVGQRLPDVINPGAAPIIVRQITDDAVVLDRGGREERLPLEKSELASPLADRLQHR